MSWSEIEKAWSELIDHIVDRWPETAAEPLLAIAGDRTRFTDYLARSHDLTLAEASEAIEAWLMQRGINLR